MKTKIIQKKIHNEKDDSIEEKLFGELKNEKSISGMFVKLIEDNKNISWKDVIKNFVEKNKKRVDIEDDSSDMVEIFKLVEKTNNKKKVKINYPKKMFQKNIITHLIKRFLSNSDKIYKLNFLINQILIKVNN